MSEDVLVVDEPVKGFPMKFEWQTNEWVDLFDEQVRLIQEDIGRAKADGRSVVYLSCPISNRGGGYFGTNVELARYTQHRLMVELGSEFWVLNPTQYQMESKEGTGLIYRHAKNLGLSREIVDNLPRPQGGDYMRMWTRVLVEDGVGENGQNFDSYYFLGPQDTKKFFSTGAEADSTQNLETYFARKFSTDTDFYNHYDDPIAERDQKRRDFIRFYGLRAGANFSKGCHDEWNVLANLNDLRLQQFGIGSQISCYFDGQQVPSSSSEKLVFPGYEKK